MWDARFELGVVGTSVGQGRPDRTQAYLACCKRDRHLTSLGWRSSLYPGCMPLAGEQLSIKEALALCNVVGFGSGSTLVVAVALMTAESGRYVGAWHDNLASDGSVASTDRGIFQINTIHAGLSDEQAYQAKPNAAFAAQLSLSKQGADFSPWAAYNSGAYEQYVPEVRQVKRLGTWKDRVKLWQ